MYDELIKRLRICATEAGACKTCELDSNPSCTDYLMKQAADAIEELERENERLHADLGKAIRQLAKYHKYDSFLALHGFSI